MIVSLVFNESLTYSTSLKYVIEAIQGEKFLEYISSNNDENIALAKLIKNCTSSCPVEHTPH